jgi:hypothetical protein
MFPFFKFFILVSDSWLKTALLQCFYKLSGKIFIKPDPDYNAHEGSGNAFQPSIAFTSDTNTGMFNPASDTIQFATGGAYRISVNNFAAYSKRVLRM